MFILKSPTVDEISDFVEKKNEHSGSVVAVSTENGNPKYKPLSLDDLREEVTVSKLTDIPKKLKKFYYKPKDKRRKPISMVKVPLGAAGEISRIPTGNLREMSDPYQKVTRDDFTDCALTDPTAQPALHKRNRSFFNNGFHLELELASSRDEKGIILIGESKKMKLKEFETKFNPLLKRIEDWYETKPIKLLQKMRSSGFAAWVQGRSAVKIFPPLSQLEQNMLPQSLKVVASEHVGNPIIDRDTWEIVALRIHSVDDDQVVLLPDEMVHVILRDSGLKQEERFFGRSIMEPFVQLCRINKRAVDFDYSKAIVASYNPKIMMKIPVQGTPDEKEEQLRARASDVASEGNDIIAIESDEFSSVDAIPNQVNHEMMSRIREDIDQILIPGMGSTKLQIGRVDGLTRDNATIMEVESIRDTRTPDEKEISDFFIDELLMPLLAHLARMKQSELPVKIKIVRDEPEDEVSVKSAFEKQDDSSQQNSATEPLMKKKGEELDQAEIIQDDAEGPLGASAKKLSFDLYENIALGAVGEEKTFTQTTDKTPIVSIINPAGSSFVGRVTYSPPLQTMEIDLNGKKYGYCKVPERIFEGFRSASSKGEFYNRSIKGQFDC